MCSALWSKPFAFAGLWEWWGGPDGKEPVESCTILTSDANELASEVHDRLGESVTIPLGPPVL